MAGAEAVQLYVKAPQDGIFRPLRELKGFVKVFLDAKETKEISFELDERSFAVWSDGWKVPGGIYTVELGASSEDIRLSASIRIEGEKVPVPEWQKGSWYECPHGLPSDGDFKMLYGKAIQQEPKIKKGSLTMEMSSMEMKDVSKVMNLLFKTTERTIARGFGGKIDYSDPAFKMMVMSGADSPLRALVLTSAGSLPAQAAERMLAIANSRPSDVFRIIEKKIKHLSRKHQ
jgi:beta-glucosidase